MSSSPKYVRIRFQAALDRRLRAESRRAAAVMRQQRLQAAAEARLRREVEMEQRRLQKLQQTSQALVAEVDSLSAEFTSSAMAQHAEYEPVAAELVEVRRLASHVTNVSDARQIRIQVRGLAVEIRRATRQHGKVVGAAVRQSLTSLVRRVAAIDAATAKRINAQAYTRLLDSVEQLEVSTSKVQTDPDALSSVKNLEREVADFEMRIADADQQMDRQFKEASRRVDELRAAIEELRADPLIQRWCLTERMEVERKCETTFEAFDREEYDLVVSAAGDIARLAGTILELGEHRDHQQRCRDQLARSIVQSMAKLGFVVQTGSPALEDSLQPTSPIRIEARRIGGGRIAVSIPQDGDVSYRVEGLPMRTERSRRGQQIRTCDEAEVILNQLHKQLTDSFEMEVGEISWEGKDPDRISRTAKESPSIPPDEFKGKGQP